MINLNVSDYDTVIIAFSGGKDSLACALWAIEKGFKNIELWHHLVDGREGSTLMDWRITDAYCEAVAEALGLPLYYSWLQGGFEGAMLKENARKRPTSFECPDGSVKQAGGVKGKLATRRMWPEKSAKMPKRWCSPELKIDVCAIAIRNQDRFNDSRTLVVTGERAEESAARASYLEFEPDRSDNRDGRNKRHVDRARPIHKWDESKVWEIIERHRIDPHPAYKLGWSRLSCMACIFGSANQWATIKAIAPEKFAKIVSLENEMNHTVNTRKEGKAFIGISVETVAESGTPYPAALNNPELVKLALGDKYDDPVIVDQWVLPAGAFGENAGPS